MLRRLGVGDYAGSSVARLCKGSASISEIISSMIESPFEAGDPASDCVSDWRHLQKEHYGEFRG